MKTIETVDLSTLPVEEFLRASSPEGRDPVRWKDYHRRSAVAAFGAATKNAGSRGKVGARMNSSETHMWVIGKLVIMGSLEGRGNALPAVSGLRADYGRSQLPDSQVATALPGLLTRRDKTRRLHHSSQPG